MKYKLFLLVLVLVLATFLYLCFYILVDDQAPLASQSMKVSGSFMMSLACALAIVHEYGRKWQRLYKRIVLTIKFFIYQNHNA